MKNVYVIGDSCVDEFVYGKCTRINPEAPTPVFVANGVVKSNLGMAGNVLTNIKSLNPNLSVILIQPNGIHINKRRFVDKDSNYIVLRVDNEPKVPEVFKFDASTFIPSISNPSCIVVSDYNKDFLSERELCKLFTWTRENNIPSFLDTKKRITSEWASNVDYIKINTLEFNQSFPDEKTLEEFLSTARKTTIIKTAGELGCICYYYANGEVLNYSIPTEKIDVRDVSGAGDTFMAALVVDFLRTSGKSLFDSCYFANKAASFACTKPGVVAVTAEELI